MLILGLDCAGGGCGVALTQGGLTLGADYQPMQRGQDQRLLPMVSSILAETGMTFSQLDRVAVSRGPGSFTGMRIGLAAARGLGLALERPVLGIERFALFRQAWPDRPLLTLLNSRRAELFCQYDDGVKEASPFLATADALSQFDRPNLFVTGDAAASVSWNHASCLTLPEPEAVLLARYAQTQNPDTCPALPLYLRAPNVSQGPPPAVEAV